MPKLTENLLKRIRNEKKNYDLIRARFRKNWTEEEAFEKTKSVDHEGHMFSSDTEMCLFWGITFEVFSRRMRAGWSIEKALTTASTTGKRVCDHKGCEYESLNAMARAYGIDASTLRARLQRGYSLEEALESPVIHWNNRYVSDHLGHVYPNISEMCMAWGINRSLYDQRKRKGWSVEKILTTPVATPTPVVDHQGKAHSSFRKMCEAWSMDHRTVASRLKKGLTLREALETPPEKRVFRAHLATNRH